MRGLEIQIVLEITPKQPLPNVSVMTIPKRVRFNEKRRPYGLRRWVNRHLREVDRRRALANQCNWIWHATFFNLPPGNWRGPTVVMVYDMIYEKYADTYFQGQAEDDHRRQKLNAVKSADVILAISETTRQDVIEYYGVNAEHVATVPLASSDLFSVTDARDLLPENMPPFLLYVGRRTRYKNFIVLLQAYAAWKLRHKIALLVVGGEDWTTKELSMIGEHKLNVRRLTGVSDEKLNQLYNAAVAFVLTSHYEGFGIPLLEAMASGCPIVASHIPSTVEVAGDYPVYFDPDDSDSLCVALNQISTVTRIFQAIETPYTWDATTQKILDVYRRVSR